MLESSAQPQPAQTPRSSLFYGKTVLAPMVRVCSLGFRMLCAESGADAVFTEEVVAAKLRQCRREVRRYPGPLRPNSNKDGNSRSEEEGEEVAEYVVYEPFRKAFKRAVVLAVHARPSSGAGQHVATVAVPVVLQLGACDAEVAADAAALCCADVDAVDVNMGCPKKFSVDNGFGAALMEKTATAGAILRRVHECVNSTAAVAARSGRVVPVSFKTRLADREDAAATVAMLCAILDAAGHTASTPVVHAITLHARVREQRSEEAPLLSTAAEVSRLCRADAILQSVCLVLNGSIAGRSEAEAQCRVLGFHGAMIARAALCDPATVFCAADATGPAALKERDEAHYMAVMKALILSSARYRAEFKNVKYHLTRAFPEVSCLKPRMPDVQSQLRGYKDCLRYFAVSEAQQAQALLWLPTVKMVDVVPTTDVKGEGDRENGDMREGKRQRLDEGH